MQLGHGNNVLNEALRQIGGADNDVDNPNIVVSVANLIWRLIQYIISSRHAQVASFCFGFHDHPIDVENIILYEIYFGVSILLVNFYHLKLIKACAEHRR